MRLLTALACLLFAVLVWGTSWADGRVREAPRLVAQMGHRFIVNSVAFAPDGKKVLSGSNDHTVKLWDVATGQALRTFDGHSGFVTSVAFAPDGMTILSGSHDRTLKLWDVNTGQELRTFVGHSNWVTSVAFSPDGKTVLSGSWDQTLKLWDVATGQELRTFSGHAGVVNGVAFSPDGKSVLSASDDHTVKRWDVATGQALRKFSLHAIEALSVAISPDGKRLVSNSSDWNLKLWDMATGQSLRTFSGHADWVESVAISSDGRTLLSGSRDNTLKLWDVATGQEIRTFSGHSRGVTSSAFSPDGKTVLSGSEDNTLKLWDLATGQEIRTFSGHSLGVTSIALAPDGRRLLSGRSDNSLAIWEADPGQQVRTLVGHSEEVNSVAFSPDGKMALSGSEDGFLKLWDVASGQEIRSSHYPRDAVKSVAFSPDGKMVLAGNWTWPRIEDEASGQALRTFRGHSKHWYDVAFSADGAMLLSGGEDGSLRLWNPANGQESRAFKGHVGGVLSVAFSPDDKAVLSGGYDRTLKLWDVTTGKGLHTFIGHGDWVASVAFSADGKTAFSGSYDRTLKLWDLTTGQELLTFKGHSGTVKSITLSPDGKMLLSGSHDGTIKLWNPTTGRLLATLTSFSDGTWAVSDPAGRFDASNGGDNPHLHWVFDNTPISLAQLKDRYYDPGLLAKVMGFNPEPLRTVPEFEDALLHKWPETSVTLDESDPHRLYIHLANRGDGYGRVRVRLNGKEIASDATAGRVLDGLKATLQLDLDPSRLLPGDNRVDVVAWPAVGHIPSPEVVITVPAVVARGPDDSGFEQLPDQISDQPVTLHAVIVGVAQYAGESLRLAFAGKDAADFAKALELGAERLFGTERVRLHLLSDHAEDDGAESEARRPTRANLRQAFESVAAEARAGDILVVYLAGHGVMAPGDGGDADYYYLTHEAQGLDLADPVVRKLWGVSSRELTDWIKAVRAAKQVMILDTCSAGGAIEKLVAERRVPGAQIIALEQLKDRTGLHILAGAAADRVSYEASHYGQGLLTYSLMTGLKGAALKGEGIVDVQTLFQYARDQVPRLASQLGGIQEPRLASPKGESFAIGRMAEQDRRQIPLAAPKPMVLRANFQDEIRWQDQLKLAQRFNDRLRLETYTTRRGKLVFVDAEDFPEAWYLRGRYTQQSDIIQLQARLFRGNEQQGAFEVRLPTDDEEAQVEMLFSAMLEAMERVHPQP